MTAAAKAVLPETSAAEAKADAQLMLRLKEMARDYKVEGCMVSYNSPAGGKCVMVCTSPGGRLAAGGEEEEILADMRELAVAKADFEGVSLEAVAAPAPAVLPAGFSIASPAAAKVVVPADTLLGTLLVDRMFPTIVPDAQQDSRFVQDPFVVQHQVRFFLQAPFVHKGPEGDKFAGTLVLFAREGGERCLCDFGKFVQEVADVMHLCEHKCCLVRYFQ